MAKYLVILSHCVVQFCEFGFCFPFQPELLIDEVDPFLSFLFPFYLSCSIAKSCPFLSLLMLSLDSFENM